LGPNVAKAQSWPQTLKKELGLAAKAPSKSTWTNQNDFKIGFEHCKLSSGWQPKLKIGLG
jgi:hypothetical protein